MKQDADAEKLLTAYNCIQNLTEKLQHRQQELDAARLEVERLRGALEDVRDCHGYTECLRDIAREALAAQQEKG